MENNLKMKVIKLDNRHTAFKLGFTHALRFDHWGDQARKAEGILSKTYNTASYNKKGPYYSKFGRKPKESEMLPYVINLRYEADITLLLLNGVAVG